MAPKENTVFKNISPTAWEHPADKAALSTVRKDPAINTVLKKLLGSLNDRSIRLLALSSYVRVGPTQFSQVYNLHKKACTILDAPFIPELYITNDPGMNAWTTGIEVPIVVLNSSLVQKLTPEELLFVIGHEVGHGLSGHMLYNTLIWVMTRISAFFRTIPVAVLALEVLKAALADWARKSEYSADRAGLLVVQDPELVYKLQMKMAGGTDLAQMDINEFFLQAAEYDKCGDLMDSLQKLLNLMSSSHPFMVLRLTELKTWVDKGDYGKILAGNYRRRDSEDHNLNKNFQEAADKFKEDLARSQDPLNSLVNDFVDNFSDSARQVTSFFENFFKNDSGK